jgi:hypothetical protein
MYVRAKQFAEERYGNGNLNHGQSIDALTGLALIVVHCDNSW